MKIGAQREQLEHTLVDIGYEVVKKEGTSLMAALNRSNPATSALSNSERRLLAERIYIQSVFGAMAKHPYPIQNLLAACSKANLYTPTGASRSGYSVMIVPPGMELSRFTRPEEMVFSISGLNKNEHGKVTMPLNNVMTDNTSNLRILVHIPTAGYKQYGAAHPEVESSGLSDMVGWGTYYLLNDGETRITDFKKRNWATIDTKSIRIQEIMAIYGGFNDTYKSCFKYDTTNVLQVTGVNDKVDIKGVSTAIEFIAVRPKMIAMMSSAILCTKPGAETGELLIAYPSTGKSL